MALRRCPCACALLCCCYLFALWAASLTTIQELAGPKSGILGGEHRSHCEDPLKLGQTIQMDSKDRGEGSGWTMPSRRGSGNRYNPSKHSPKMHGPGLEASPGTFSHVAVKRSLRRARQRAKVDGWTFYKGKLLTLAALGGNAEVPRPWRPPHPGASKPHLPKAGKRAAFVSWNAGGLTTEVYQDLLAWLEVKCIDIAVIQGTRWNGERMWSTRGYHILQCGEPEGTKHAHSGLMTFVSNRICAADAISFSNIIPGRLMHIKCRLGPNSLDIVNVYQHPDQHSSVRKDPLAARGEVWNQLDRLLHRLARRNLTVIAGDFNCPLKSQSKLSTHCPTDMYEFVELTRKYHLGTVRAHDHTPTFIGHQGHSIIDFVLMPTCQMDAHCRNGRTLPDFPVASWRAIRDHLPIVCSIPMSWKCWYNRPKEVNVLSRPMQQVLRDACHSCDSTWMDLQAQLTQQVVQKPPVLQAVSQLVQDTLQTCCHVLRPLTLQRPMAYPSHRSLLAQLWHSYAQIRRTSHTSSAALFNAWKHQCRLRLIKRRLSQACKQAKVSRLQCAVDQANAAAQRHDTRALFAVIRKLTPRTPYRAIRLHGSQGEALTAEEECQQFRDHFATVFCSDSPNQDPALQTFQSLPFSYDELHHALAHAPVTKAVGPKALPNLLLRMLSEPLCDWLWHSLQHDWCLHLHPHIPQGWKDAWLVLLAKRRVKHATDVRPIALTDSLGRTILGLLTRALKKQVYPQITHLPIFAFVPNRGTLEALYFVCNHCRTVRTLCEAASNSYWKRSSAQPLVGGMMLSLDMSQAFDRLPRSHLAEGFQHLDIDPTLTSFFLHWLHEATYHFQHRGSKCSITTTQGVRQGCKASPLEWTIFLLLILTRLDAALTTPEHLSWVKQHLVTYADDLLAMWCISEKAHVHRAIAQIGTVLDVLADLGMQVNLSKSVVLLRLSGRQSQTMKKKLLIKTTTGYCLRIPRKHGHTLLPVVPNHSYLGIKISYFQFEDQTLKHRLQIGRTAFVRLRPWLVQRHTFPLKLRIGLWVSCIRSACLHGLQATGLTPAGALRLHRHFASDIRRIAKSPSYVTHETTADLFCRLNLPLPLIHLQDFWQQQHDRAHGRWEGLAPNDILHSFDMHAHHQHIMHVFQLDDSVDMTDMRLCPYCDFTTMHQSHLTKHLRSVHLVPKQTPEYFPLRDALAGHPQCTHCLRRLTNRAGLKGHICANHCHLFDMFRPSQAALADDPQLRAMAANGDWTPLWTNDALLKKVREQCTLCGLHYSTRKSMVDHLQQDHRRAWEFAQPSISKIAGAVNTNPCQACGHTGKRTHICPVVRQLACITALEDQHLQTADLATLPPLPEAPLTSPLKRARLADSSPTASTAITFQPARDAHAGGPTCAHCGAVNKTMYILWRHIEDGACRMFQAERPIGAHVPSVWPNLLQRAHHNPLSLLHDEETTLLLCGTCVLCGQQLQRTGALLPHLQKDHPVIMNEVQAKHAALHHQLIQDTLCRCGSRRISADHRCPVHQQIVILHYLGNLQTASPPSPQWTQADFEALWMNPTIRAKLTQTCAICNETCGIHALGPHLEAHADMIAALMPLLPLAQCPTLDCCDACLSAPAVLPFCPVALNLSAYLCHGHGRRNLFPLRGGHDGRDGRELGQLATGPDQQKSQANSWNPSASATSSNTSTTFLSVKGLDPAHTQARKPAAGPSHGRPIHSFFTIRPTRSASADVSSQLTMEGAATQRAEHYGSAHTSLPGAHPGTTHETGESAEGQTPRRSLDRVEDSKDPDRARRLALHAVQPAEESPGAHARQDPYLDGSDEAMGGGTQRTGTISQPDPTLQSPQEADDITKRRLDFTLAVTGEWPDQSTMGASHVHEPLGSLAAALLPIETPPIEIQPFGRTAGKTVGQPIQGDQASAACLKLRLKNDGVICYVNANLLAYLWGMVQRSNPDWTDFANGNTAFQSLLTDGLFGSFAFETVGFEGLSQSWGRQGRQEDAHEFTSTLLDWGQPRCVNEAWSRQMSTPDGITIYDTGSRGMPPTMTIGDCEKGVSCLQNIVDAWHTHSGMLTCFHEATELIGIHLDRLTRDSSGAICRAAWDVEMDPVVLLPFWSEPGSLFVHHREYVPASAIFHEGSIHSGHLRAALMGADGWYLTEDERVALPDPQQLADKLQCITFVWLIREDALLLHRPAPPMYGKDAWVTRATWYLFHGKYYDIKYDNRLLEMLSQFCADCGAPFFGPMGLYSHIMTNHPGLGVALHQEYRRIMDKLNVSQIPCDLCHATWFPPGSCDLADRFHVCSTVMNLALAWLYYGSALAPIGTRYNMPAADTPPELVGYPAPPTIEDTMGAFLDALTR